MGNFSWIQFIQKKNNQFFSVFSLLQIGAGFPFAPKEIIQDPKFTTRLRRWCGGRFRWMRSLWRSSRLFLVGWNNTWVVMSLKPIARPLPISSQRHLHKTIWSFHLHHLAAPLVAHLRAERHAESTRARWSRWRVRKFKANFTAVFGSLGTPIKLPGNMSCDRSNFSSITRLAALKKRGQFQGFHDHLLPRALSMFSASAEVLRLKQLKNS